MTQYSIRKGKKYWWVSSGERRRVLIGKLNHQAAINLACYYARKTELAFEGGRAFGEYGMVPRWDSSMKQYVIRKWSSPSTTSFWWSVCRECGPIALAETHDLVVERTEIHDRVMHVSHHSK